jgi:hypothetical protein
VAGPTRAAPRKATFCDLHHRLLLNALITCRLAAAPSLNPPRSGAVARSPGCGLVAGAPFHRAMCSVARQILCSASSVTLSPVITRSSPSRAIRSKNLPIRAIRSRISAVNVPDLARRSIVFSSAPEGSASFRIRWPDRLFLKKIATSSI